MKTKNNYKLLKIQKMELIKLISIKYNNYKILYNSKIKKILNNKFK